MSSLWVPRGAISKFPYISNRSTLCHCLRLSNLAVNESRMRFQNEGPSDTNIYSIAHMQVVGNGAFGMSKSVWVRNHRKRILFNCGESIESTKGIGNANRLFVTHLDWSKIGGILSLIYKAKCSKREELDVYGPPGLGVFVRAAECFFRIPNFKVRFIDQNDDDEFVVKVIEISNTEQKPHKPGVMDKTWLKSSYIPPVLNDISVVNRGHPRTIDLEVSYSYICKLASTKAWVLSECVKRGIKPGEDMHKLWNGHEVTLEDGSLVKPEDVIKVNEYPFLIVVDIPSKGFLDDLVKKKEYELYHNSVNIFVHFTPPEVMQDERYVSWMQRFPVKSKHLIVNESNEQDSPDKLHNKHKLCQLISPKFFPNLVGARFKQVDRPPFYVENSDVILGNADPSLTFSPEFSTNTWLQKWKNMPEELQLVQTWPGTLTNLKTMDVLRSYEPLLISEKPEETVIDFNGFSQQSPKDPKISFLGTCSQGNTVYRNTSGILVQLRSNEAMLLDCGDGTMQQFATLFDDRQLDEVLLSLRCIYISHTHGDHHIGLVGLLLAIKKSKLKMKKKQLKTVLLLPSPLIAWLETYHNKFQSILDDIIVISLGDLVKGKKKEELNSLLRKMCGVRDLTVCWAKHSAFSYCLSFEHSTGWKLSYSGDTKYNMNFSRIGRKSDLLIHEATFGTGLDKMADAAKHSTTADALQVGKEMGAKFIMLTHFSKRYPIIPCMRDLDNVTNASIAFDFLQVNLSDLHLLPKLHDAYKKVFQIYELQNVEEHDRLYTRQSVLEEISEAKDLKMNGH